jgi:hypothetical protein
MQARSRQELIEALGNIPNTTKPAGTDVVGKRLAALLKAFNDQTQLRRVGLATEEAFVVELSQRLATSWQTGYHSLSQTLKELQKTNKIELAHSTLVFKTTDNLIDLNLAPALALALQFPKLELAQLLKKMDGLILTLKKNLGSIALDTFFNNILEPSKKKDFFDTEKEPATVDDLIARLDTASKRYPAIHVHETSSQAPAQQPLGKITINRDEISIKDQKIIEALKRLFKKGGPLEAFHLATITDLDSSAAVNALNKFAEDLQAANLQGYVALLTTLEKGKHLRDNPLAEIIQDTVGPWIYLALTYPDKPWEDLQDQRQALAAARKTWGKAELDGIISTHLGSTNPTANLDALSGLLVGKKPATSAASSHGKKNDSSLGLGDDDEEKEKDLDTPSATASPAAALNGSSTMAKRNTNKDPLYDDDEEEDEEEADLEAFEEEMLSQPKTAQKPPQTPAQLALALTKAEKQFSQIQKACEDADQETLQAQLEPLGLLKKDLELIKGDLLTYSMDLEMGFELYPLDEAGKLEVKTQTERAETLGARISVLASGIHLGLGTADKDPLERAALQTSAALQQQRALVITMQTASTRITSALAELDEKDDLDIEDDEATQLFHLNREIHTHLKKAESLIQWWDKLDWDKLDSKVAQQLNAAKASIYDTTKTLQTTFSALQKQAQAIMEKSSLEDELFTAVSPSATRVGTLSSIDEGDEEQEEEEELEDDDEEEEEASKKSSLTLQEMFQLTNHYRKLSFLAPHSEYHFPNKPAIYETYQQLQKATFDYCRANNITEATINQLANNYLPKDQATYLSEKQTLEKPTGPQPQAVYHFGKSCKIVKTEAQIEQAVKNITVENNFVGDVNSATLSPPLIAKDEARITELEYEGIKAASVEKYRQEASGRYCFISESHIDKKVTDPKILLPWACCTINRFFASAPAGTKSVTLEDAYPPQQCAALISYCKFMGYAYNLGPLQKLRLLADKLKAEGKIDEALHDKLTRYKTVTLTDELSALVKQDKTNWADWAATQQSQAFAATQWKTWLDTPETQQKYSTIPPLGKEQEQELLKKFNPDAPVLKQKAAARPAPTHAPHRPPSTDLDEEAVSPQPSPYASISLSRNKSAFLSPKTATHDGTHASSSSLDQEALDEEELPLASLSRKPGGKSSGKK